MGGCSAIGPWGAPVVPGDLLAFPSDDGWVSGVVTAVDGHLVQLTGSPEWHDTRVMDPGDGSAPGANHLGPDGRAKRAAIALPDVLDLDGARAALRFCDSFDRLSTLVRVWESGRITTDDWLTALGEVWSICDDVGAHAKRLMTKTPLLHALHSPALRRCLMTPDELKAFDALRGEVTIYRGCYRSNRRGLSWSLDRATAERFPSLHRYRQDGQPLLIEARASKAEHILAVKLDRGEQEVVAWQPRIVSTDQIAIA